jgi:type IV pilus assembly protein PilQ
MRNAMSLMLFFVCFMFALPSDSAMAKSAGRIEGIEHTPISGGSQLSIRYSGEGRFRVFQINAQRKVVVEGDNLTIPSDLTKTIEASAASGPVVQVTPYQSFANGRNLTKVVLQLRADVTTASSENPGSFVLDLRPKATKAITNELQGKANVKSAGPKGWSEADELKVRSGSPTKSVEVAEKLIEVLNSPINEKKYFGSRVSFESSEASVHDVFRLVGEASGLNILSDKEVGAKSASYSLKDVPWDQLLDLVIQSQQLKAGVNGNVVTITTLAQHTKLQEELQKELVASSANEPILMAVIPLSYAKAEDVTKAIEELLITPTGTANQASGGGGSGNQSNPQQQGGGQQQPSSGSASSSANQPGSPTLVQAFKRGKIQSDTRTNSLLVTNTKSAIERIKRLVKELDIPAPQVLIDSRFVTAQEVFVRKLGVQWGTGAAATGRKAGVGIAYGGGAAVVPSIAGNAVTPFLPATSDAQTVSGLFRIGSGDFGFLQAQLQLSEKRETTRTISSPRVIVENTKTATISDGNTRFNLGSAGVGASASPTPVEAKLSLSVTPTVASDGAVRLEIKLSQSSFPSATSNNTANKDISTTVMVDSGSTLVLGGVYQFGDSLGEDGIPVLKDLPFIGDLFKQTSKNRNKSEMLVFVTPQVVDTDTPLGLSGDRSQL